jgi:hypothetical protein
MSMNPTVDNYQYQGDIGGLYPDLRQVYRPLCSCDYWTSSSNAVLFRNGSLLSGFCLSSSSIASGFLHTPSLDGHPCF